MIEILKKIPALTVLFLLVSVKFGEVFLDILMSRDASVFRDIKKLGKKNG